MNHISHTSLETTRALHVTRREKVGRQVSQSAEKISLYMNEKRDELGLDRDEGILSTRRGTYHARPLDINASERKPLPHNFFTRRIGK